MTHKIYNISTKSGALYFIHADDAKWQDAFVKKPNLCEANKFIKQHTQIVCCEPLQMSEYV